MRGALWVGLVVLAGCMRGCPSRCGGEPATPCASDRECEDPERCHEGYCTSPEVLSAVERCRQAPECRERGACSLGLTRTFLGASSKHTCLVERSEDCAASRLCAELGRCSLARTQGVLSDGYCAARADHECEASARCEQFEECTRDGDACVRAWPDCSGEPLARLDPRSELGAPYTPGDLGEAIIACRLETRTRETTTFVRVANRCLRGPEHTAATTVFAFRSKLAASDAVALAIQKNPRYGTPKIARYVRAAYTGRSPFSGSEDKVTMTCHVIAPEVAVKLTGPALARAGAALARLTEERPALDRAEPRELAEVRAALSEAATWNPGDPGIAKLQTRLDVALEGWRRALDAAIAKLAPDDVGPKRAKLRVLRRICGADLRPRDSRDDECGIEVAIEVAEEMRLGRSGGDVTHLRLLRPGAEPAVVEAEILDVRTATTSTPEVSLVVPPGEEAIVRIAPRTITTLGEGAILIGSDFLARERFALRL